jgi:hypothetical protein
MVTGTQFNTTKLAFKANPQRYRWDLGPWVCNAGNQTRTISCLDESGAVVANGLCPSPQPATTQTCRAMPVPANPAFNGSINPPPEKPCMKTTNINIGGSNSGSFDPNAGSFRFGIWGDNYWGAGSRKDVKKGRICARFPGTVEVYIKDVRNVQQFYITNIIFDDIQGVAINGRPVYQTDGRIGYYGQSGWHAHVRGCENGTNFANHSAYVDLRPYMRNGYNLIQIDHFVAGGGEGAVVGVVRLKPGVDNDTSCQ